MIKPATKDPSWAVQIGAKLPGRIMGRALDLLRPAFPTTVRIETTNHCNAVCTFCPRESIGRDKTVMDQDLYEDIIAQSVAGGCREIHVHNFGEPLIDKRLPARIRYAKDQGVPRVKIISNGALLRGKTAERLLASGLDELKVSIDGASAKEFNEVRVGLDYDQIIGNLRAFKKMRDQRGSGPRMVAGCTVTSDKAQTRRMLADVVDSVDFSKLHNWAGARRFLPMDGVRKPCDRLWRTFTILVNGDVALCCLDYSGRHVLGNCR